MASDETLTDAEARLLEGLLHSERLALDDELRGLDRSLREVREARSSESADDEHDPEGPTLSSEWSRIHGVHGELQHKSDAVERALERIADGSYGLCTRCGRPIGYARLDARPAAELCIECARG